MSTVSFCNQQSSAKSPDTFCSCMHLTHPEHASGNTELSLAKTVLIGLSAPLVSGHAKSSR